MKINEYQDEIVEWHSRRYPTRSTERVAMKLAEESGEVQGAILKHEGDHRVLEEIGDVLNVCAVLLDCHGFKMSEAIDYARTVRKRKTSIYGD